MVSTACVRGHLCDRVEGLYWRGGCGSDRIAAQRVDDHSNIVESEVVGQMRRDLRHIGVGCKASQLEFVDWKPDADISFRARESRGRRKCPV